MVRSETILCSTDGIVGALTPTPLRNPLTGENAILPTGAAVKKIAIYRDGNNLVTDNCMIQLGIIGDTARYIDTPDNNSTNQLNFGQTISRMFMNESGLHAAEELRLTLSETLELGSIVFEITYCVYS